MKYLILLFMSAQAHAGAAFIWSDAPPTPRASRPPTDTRTEAVGECAQCHRPSTVMAPLPPPRPRTFAPRATSITFRTRGKPLGAACRSLFMNERGEYGSVGRRIANLIGADPYRRHFINGTSLRAFCPRYASLSAEQQAQAWVWFWMVLANEESTCNPSLRHATHYPDGRVLNPKPGYGLYAAELYAQHRSWRGAMCRGDIRSTQTQVNCAVHTMAATQLAPGRGVRWVSSYWGPIRRASRQILPNMRGFKSCF